MEFYRNGKACALRYYDDDLVVVVLALALRSPDWAGAAASALGAAVWLWPLHCVPEAEAVLVSLAQQALPVAPCWQHAALGALAGEEAVVAVWAELTA